MTLLNGFRSHEVKTVNLDLYEEDRSIQPIERDYQLIALQLTTKQSLVVCILVKDWLLIV